MPGEIVQLDPVVIPTDETEEERRLREAREVDARALEQLQAPVPAAAPSPEAPVPTAAPPAQQDDLVRDAPRAYRPVAREAQIAGDAYRAQIPATQRADTAQRMEERAAMARELLADPQGFVGPSGRGPQRPPPPPPVTAPVPPPPQSNREKLRQLLTEREGMAAKQAGAPVPNPLPQAPDYTDADVSDAVRRPLHAIGNALRALGGRGPNAEFRSSREALAARYREDLQRAQGLRQQGEQRVAAQQRMGLEREQMGAQAQERTAGRALQETREQRLTADADRRADLAERVAEARMRALGSDAERSEAAGNPRSGISQAMQTAYRMRLASRPAAVRARMAQQLGVDEAQLDAQIGTLSANQINALMPHLSEDTRDLNTRQRTGGGGGGAGAATGTPERAQLEQQLADAGIPSAGVDLTSRRGREQARSELLHRTRPQARAELGQRVERYGTARRQSGVSEARSALQGVVRQLNRHVPGWRAGRPDIPGIGATALAPDFMLTRGGRDVSGAMERLLDTQLREATGAAAPPSEVGTFRRILGVVTLATDRDMIEAIRRAEEILEDRDSELIRTFGEDAAQEWRRRGDSAARQQPGPSVRESSTVRAVREMPREQALEVVRQERARRRGGQ